MWRTIFLFYVTLAGISTLPLNQTKVTKAESYRLPGTFLPSNYKIDLDVTNSFTKVEGPHRFQGIVTITGKVTENIKTIRIHANRITVKTTPAKPPATDDTLNINIYRTSAAERNLFNSIDYANNAVYHFWDLQLTELVTEGTELVIEIDYEGLLLTDMYGFYISSYDNEQHVLTTQFQPTHARRAFPCFDEPEYKAFFEITIKRPSGYKSLSNTRLLRTEENPVITDVFERTPEMSTYLVAFIVSKFDSKFGKEYEFKVWARPNAIKQTRYIADLGINIVKDLNNFLGINYFNEMINKLDMVAIPDFSAGAMENWGLLTYRETYLLVDEDMSTDRDKQNVASVVAHEMAHQWFGDWTTTRWWQNTWLNEGFATYFEYHTTGNVLPEWEMKDQFVIEQQQSVFATDALAKTTPLNHSVNSPEEISSHFGSISYNKGGSVIRMMEHVMGSKTFQEGLKRYLKEHEKKSTVPIDLYNSLQAQVEEDLVDLDFTVGKIMETWVDQPGYPVVNVTARDDGLYTISQERFYLSAKERNKPKNDKLWFIPISYTTSKEANFDNLAPKLWLTPKESSKIFQFNDDLDWILLNIQESGYYRVNYDTHLWEKIAEYLKTNRQNVHKLNRAQLIDDAMNLARAGLVKYELAFEITNYLEIEDNYYPWYSAFQGFRYLLQRYAEDDETGMNIRFYILSLMKKLIKDKDFKNIKDEKQIDAFNRVAALDWACNLGNATCIKNAVDLFNEFKKDQDISKIPKNLKSIVYCTALRNASEADWDMMWTRYKTVNVAAEKISILNALGCSNNEIILKKYLEYSLTNDVREQDANYVFSSVYTGTSKGVDIAFKFLQDNYAAIGTKFGGLNAIGNIITGLAGRLNSGTQILEFTKFLDKHKDELQDVKDAALEKATENIEWAEKYSKDISEYITGRLRRNSAMTVISNSLLCFSFSIFALYMHILL